MKINEKLKSPSLFGRGGFRGRGENKEEGDLGGEIRTRKRRDLRMMYENEKIKNGALNIKYKILI